MVISPFFWNSVHQLQVYLLLHESYVELFKLCYRIESEKGVFITNHSLSVSSWAGRSYFEAVVSPWYSLFFYSLLWTSRNLMHAICSHWMTPSLYMHCLQKVLTLSGIPVAIGNRLLIMCIFYDVSIPNNYSSDCWCITFCMHWDFDVCFREQFF